MGQLSCNSSGATPALNATTGAGTPSADIIDVTQTSTGYAINVASSSSSNPGVFSSQSGGSAAIHGDSTAAGGPGVKATTSSAAGNALLAQNTAGAGASTGNGIHALSAQSSGSAIWAQNTNGGNGITAQNTSGGTAISASTTDTAVACLNAANNSTTGNADGAFVTTASASGIGVLAESTSTSNAGSAPTGVYGSSASGVGYGIYGKNTASSNNGIGVLGAGWKYSVYADSPGSGTGLAFYANGNSTIGGNLTVTGNFTVSGTKGFAVDHPLDPANKYLVHSSVESPDRKNVYDGVVEADAQGEADVALPHYFDALNGDVRYQLTPIGGPAPDLHVKSEVSSGRFVIGGAKPKQRVSWQITGVRRDAWARQNPMVVEPEKGADERGHYLQPVAHGRSEDERERARDLAVVRRGVDALSDAIAGRARHREAKRKA